MAAIEWLAMVDHCDTIWLLVHSGSEFSPPALRNYSLEILIRSLGFSHTVNPARGFKPPAGACKCVGR